MTHNEAAALRLVGFTITVALKGALLWRMYETRRLRGGQRTTTVARDDPKSAGRGPERNRVDFLDFSDYLRYSPASVLAAQNVLIGLVALMLLSVFGMFCWLTADKSNGIALAIFGVSGLAVLATLFWVGNRLRLARRRRWSDARLQDVGIRRRIEVFRVQRVEVYNATDVFIVIACWSDDAGREWETRCGPVSGDPTAYFRRHPLVVLQDPERTEDSRVDPTFLPLANWRGMMDPMS